MLYPSLTPRVTAARYPYPELPVLFPAALVVAASLLFLPGAQAAVCTHSTKIAAEQFLVELKQAQQRAEQNLAILQSVENEFNARLKNELNVQPKQVQKSGCERVAADSEAAGYCEGPDELTEKVYKIIREQTLQDLQEHEQIRRETQDALNSVAADIRKLEACLSAEDTATTKS